VNKKALVEEHIEFAQETMTDNFPQKEAKVKWNKISKMILGIQENFQQNRNKLFHDEPFLMLSLSLFDDVFRPKENRNAAHHNPPDSRKLP
jgi:hypothetical protein